mmetsp:Transcript_10855/g.16195  ORF Transcript_10855/g.16195 Transcript_10855/m.16195 type:complete len:88 (+) Transcript_10855:434-697(+)
MRKQRTCVGSRLWGNSLRRQSRGKRLPLAICRLKLATATTNVFQLRTLYMFAHAILSLVLEVDRESVATDDPPMDKYECYDDSFYYN